jgi:3-dehydroquinate dehydratase-2
MRILLIQGANMEWLGLREPEIYGSTTAAELDQMLNAEADSRGVALEIRYTNAEGEAINLIYEAVRGGVDGLLMNPAGFHYNAYALRDCLRGTRIPYVEVHITNLDRRGMTSVLASEADGLVMGFGLDSYVLGLDGLMRVVAKRGSGPGK